MHLLFDEKAYLELALDWLFIIVSGNLKELFLLLLPCWSWRAAVRG